MAKVFISFLGTNNYLHCNYINSDGQRVEDVKFVQEATIRMNCLDFDKFVFLLTDLAYKENWVDKDIHIKDDIEESTMVDKGLNSRLLDYIEPAKIVIQPITEGYTEEQIWDIFNIIYRHINTNDEIVIDVTHAFRSLPMLAIVLIDYLKSLKNVSVSGLFYGAFEALGSYSRAKEIPVENRDVSILNLTAFSQLQDWSKAAHNLVKYGNSEKIVELTQSQIRPILIATAGKDIAASNLRKFADNLSPIFDSIRTARGKNITFNKSYGELKELLPLIKMDLIAPLSPIISLIEDRLSAMESTDTVLNSFRAVSWCIEYGWIQQGFTILVETIITAVLRDINLDDINHLNRTIAAQVFKIEYYCLDQDIWAKESKENPDVVNTIRSSRILKKLLAEYESLTDFRNDINHCGYRQNARDQKKLSSSLKEFHCKIISKLL